MRSRRAAWSDLRSRGRGGRSALPELELPIFGSRDRNTARRLPKLTDIINKTLHFSTAESPPILSSLLSTLVTDYPAFS